MRPELEKGRLDQLFGALPHLASLAKLRTEDDAAAALWAPRAAPSAGAPPGPPRAGCRLSMRCVLLVFCYTKNVRKVSRVR